MEQRAESYLVQRRLLWIEIEKKVYDRIAHKANQAFQLYNADPGFLCSQWAEMDEDSSEGSSSDCGSEF